MMEAALGFVIGLTINWWFFIAVFCGCLWCEHDDSRFWASLWAIVFGVVGFFLFGVTWQTAWPFIVAYIPVGFLWSFWRWKRHGDQTTKAYKKERARINSDVAENENRQGQSLNHDYYRDMLKTAKDGAAHELIVSNHIDRITYWVLMWPFSFLEQFVGDIIDGIAKTIRGIANQTYNRISAKARARIEDIDATDEAVS